MHLFKLWQLLPWISVWSAQLLKLTPDKISLSVVLTHPDRITQSACASFSLTCNNLTFISQKLMTGSWSFEPRPPFKGMIRSHFHPRSFQGSANKMLYISYFQKQGFTAAGGMPVGKVPLKAADASLEIKVKMKTKGHRGNAMSFFLFFLLRYDFYCLHCKG